MIIIDLEATCFTDTIKQKFRSEIIEIGAVRDGHDKDGKAGSEFVIIIKPKLEPELSVFCKRLTHISQDMVDAGEERINALQMFKAFTDGDVLGSWGDYDRKMLILECQREGFIWDFKHVNIKDVFSQKMKHKPCGVQKALNILKLQFEGTHHRGIDDAKNILRIWTIVKEMTC